jgi:AraC-like DNA-binding protein
MQSRTDLATEEIAERLSFCDSDAFRRSLGEWIGMAPSQFRKAYHTRGPRPWLTEHRDDGGIAIAFECPDA